MAAQCSQAGGFMRRVIKAVLSCFVCLVLLAAIGAAQTNANTTKAKSNDKTDQHHSKLSKAAFWRKHNDSKKEQKPSKSAKKADSKTASKAKAKPAKSTRVKPASTKGKSAKTAQVKPVSQKSPTKKGSKSPSKTTKPVAKKTASSKTKTQSKA
jgi:hypothetical protein